MSSIVKNHRVIVDSHRSVLLSSQAVFQPKRPQEQRLQYDTEGLNIVENAKKQAKDIINDAQKEAERLRINAMAEIAEAQEKAEKEGYEQGYLIGYKEGYEQGLKEGQDKGKLEYESLLIEAERLKQKYLEDYEQLYQVSEENMVMLAIDIAKKIIGEAADKYPETYLDIAYKALKMIQGQKTVHLRVSSEGFPAIRDNKKLLMSRLEGIEDINIVEDAFLDKGSCIIDTGNGVIDASVETQMEAIESALIEIMHST